MQLPRVKPPAWSALGVGDRAWQQGPMEATVKTADGAVRGARVGSGMAFLGLPFAAPPTGQGRFRAPQPVQPWQGERDARSVGPAAVQPASMMPGLPPTSEDCLYLNVWTPGPGRQGGQGRQGRQGGRRPVIVWLHGGAFNTGSGGQDMYSGQALAERNDVVVVTVNYRLGALGFGHLRGLLPAGLEVEDNLALLDQLRALDWVRAHIADFGGDPECVTLAGQSAGAMCTGLLLSSTAAAGKFQRAILQSGGASHCIGAEAAAQVGAHFLHALGVSAAKPDALWRASSEEVLAAQVACGALTVARGRPGRQVPERGSVWYPLADGGLLPPDPQAAIAAGQGVKVPVLAGSNRHEWNFYLYLSDTGKLTLDEAGLRKVLSRRMPEHAEAAVDHYLAQHYGRDCEGYPAVFSAIEGDRTFRVPVQQLAEAHAGHVAQTFVYDFAHPTALAGGRMGAFHGAELPFTFGQTATPFGRAMCGEGPGVEATSHTMMDAWCGFAREGVPGPDGAFPAFPAYDAVRRATTVFAETRAVVEAPDEATRAFWAERL